MFNLFKDRFPVTHSEKEGVIDNSLDMLKHTIRGLIKEKFSSKLKIYVLDSGSCNGCELELQLLFSPLYELSFLGLEVVYDIIEADILLITGLMTENMYVELEMIYGKLKEPKRVITVGDCPVFTAPFKETFALKNNAEIFYSSSYHIVGCPPEPIAILEGLKEYLKKDEYSHQKS
ncbi:MAG: Formate hydrogenlyase subunit 7 [uncultured Sulfurovum sp.]|uniref:Formate hydrogenlyase subunit 7 n=1 Tax=uncultured Sulfurovum sp. TaxID=269237 RepID=A0A6S6S4S7_9BACT|nr:MAG: Formate hydrogenlyase subunit 7 [uncultured Sulfurovum sp.]